MYFLFYTLAFDDVMKFEYLIFLRTESTSKVKQKASFLVLQVLYFRLKNTTFKEQIQTPKQLFLYADSEIKGVT